MALGNGALPLRGTEGKESRVDFFGGGYSKQYPRLYVGNPGTYLHRVCGAG